MEHKKVDSLLKLSELSSLLDLSNPPKDLFYQGNWQSQIFRNVTAVVGSRHMTDYGRVATEKVVASLVAQNRPLISGFMYGVDQYAHRACLNQGGKTIAVLGWGINTKLEGQEKQLAQDIVDSGGLILSEWETQKATLWTFPMRNRLVAALSEEVIVIEAAAESGSLITARLAEKLHRKIWAVPGPITSKTSVGTNLLISQGKASMWLSQKIQLKLSESTDPLISHLENEALTVDELARKLLRPVAQVGAELSLLLLSGKVSEKGGKYFLEDNAG